MADERMPITPAVLTWARERAGFEIDALSHTAGFKEIATWEKGDARPTYRQLEALADRFEVPVAVFFFSDPPEVSDFEPEFRTLGPDAFHDLTARMRFLMEKADYRNRKRQALYAMSRAPKRLIVHDLRISPDDSPESLAAEVREYLGITIEEQFDWANRHKSVENWRNMFADVGVMVTVLTFRQMDYIGFALYDPRFPLICIDASEHRWSGGILTMCHSLVHLLFHTSGLDKRDDAYLSDLDPESRQVEEICNAASTEIVVPSRSLESEFMNRLKSGNLADITLRLSHLFDVPAEWMNNRLLELNLITESQHRETLEMWARRRIGGGGGGGPDDIVLDELGEPFIKLAFECFDNGLFDEDTLADYVELPRLYLDDLRELLAR
ncbi:MAG: XRE family transcriptional regulator [Chloroflexi bacterium]|nr:XRE family transcriptional regulator [Chloroflexota bacterium]